MTRLSPAGTGAAQWTSEAGPGPLAGVLPAEDDAVAGALETEGEE